MTNKLPNCLKDVIDLKATTLVSCQHALNVLTKDGKISLSPNTKIALFTSAAFITGTILTDDGEDTVDIINQAILEMRNNFLDEEVTSDTTLINQTKIIRMKDVTITSLSNPQAKTNLAIMNVFTDQIVGFSFGSLNVE